MEPQVTLTPQQDELTIGASGAEVRRASEWLTAACERHRIPEAQTQRLEVCLNEVLANVLTHGGSAASAEPIRLQLQVRSALDAGEVSVTVCDAGLAFNPLKVEIPRRPDTLAETPEGGLGLIMIRRCSDWLDYRREGGRNHFTFGVRWKRD